MALWNRWHPGDPAAAKSFPIERLEARVHFSAAAAGTVRLTGVEPVFQAAPPAPPADVSASVTDDGLRVRWDDRSNDEAGFIVERSRTQGFANVESVTLVGPNVESYVDTAFLSETPYYYRVRAYNAAGESAAVAATAAVSAPAAAVAGRHVFYNGSAYDGGSTAATVSDDRAVATDKRALLPGTPASFDNVTSFTRGLNGIMVDLASLRGRAPRASDFTVETGGGAGGTQWASGPPPATLVVRRGAGDGGSDRITLLFATGAIQNTWLRLTVLPGEHSGLTAPDVFYFGNLIGDANGDFRVNALDVAAVKRELNSTVGITSRTDVNRDGRVNALDVAAVKQNLNRSLPSFTAPAAPSAAAIVAGSARDDAAATTAVLLE